MGSTCMSTRRVIALAASLGVRVVLGVAEAPKPVVAFPREVHVEAQLAAAQDVEVAVQLGLRCFLAKVGDEPEPVWCVLVGDVDG